MWSVHFEVKQYLFLVGGSVSCPLFGGRATVEPSGMFHALSRF